MIIEIIAVGRMKSGPESELLKHYLSRAEKTGRGVGVRDFAVREIAEGRGETATIRKRREAESIDTMIADADASCCFDERGTCMTSPGLADLIRGRAEQGTKRLAFVIGGPDGLDLESIGASEGPIAFGRVTWPHQIVRILLAEQLYRAMTILTNHPYHRA